MKFEMILLYLRATGQTLEWTTPDGRTFQIAGDPRLAGYWERFFPKGEDPYRRRATAEETEAAFLPVQRYLLYRTLHNDGRQVSREELFALIRELFPQD